MPPDTEIMAVPSELPQVASVTEVLNASAVGSLIVIVSIIVQAFESVTVT